MAEAAAKEVSVFEYEGAFKATLQAKVFCSPYWQDRTCREVDTSEGRKVRVDPGIYPPGGKGATAMRRCESCGKWAPHGVTDIACADCQVEGDQDEFVQRVGRLERGDTRGIGDTLRQLWWRRPFMPQRREDDANANEKKKKKKKKNPKQAKGEDEDEDAPPIMEITTFREEGTPGGRHWMADLIEVPERPATRLNSEVLSALLHRHLEWVARDAPRRAVGCSVVLLPEAEAKLAEEIAYHEATGRIMPRARRANTVNPRIPYRRRARAHAGNQ